MDLLAMLGYEFFGNSVRAWLASLGMFLLVWLALVTLRRFVRKRLLGSVGSKSPVAVQIAHTVVVHTGIWFHLLVALYVASRLLAPSRWTEELVPQIVTVGLVVQLGLWASSALTTFWSLRRARQLAADPGTVAAMDLVGFLLRLVVWTAVLLLLLDNLGINVTTLIAGLGVGGIAVALAAQNVLGDLFSSLSIVLDKPFVVGDFIAVADFLGSVEHVGLKTTRLRSLSGEQVVFSNSDLLNSRIRNYGRMFERRIVGSLRVTYQTPPAKLRRVAAVIREVIEAQDKVRFDRAHFQGFGEFALMFEYVYYVLTPEYTYYMDVQQNINLAIMDKLAAEGVEFALPARTVFLSGTAS